MMNDAYWKYDDNGIDWNIGCWKCSNCGCRNKNIGASKYQNPYVWAGSKYCPNCGKQMNIQAKLNSKPHFNDTLSGDYLN